MPTQKHTQPAEAPQTATPTTELTSKVARAPLGPDPESYRQYARPETARLLRALGLDVTYIEALGDQMVYEHRGRRHEVTDLMGGYGANLFGHHHPALVACMRQALDDRAPVQAQASCRAWAGALARELSRRIGESTGQEYVVTFANTGAEAIEAALKHAELERHAQAEQAARRFRRRMNVLLADADADQAAFLREVGRELGLDAARDAASALRAIARANDEARRQPPVFFALERAFHGKTTGASQLTYHPAYREPFGRIGVRCEFLPAGDSEAWARAIARATVRTWEVGSQGGRLTLQERPWVNVSAILVEPIQGEGGIHPLDPESAAAIRQIADTHGLPLIVDEIQSGLGRTGAFLAASASGLTGDYYAFAKSLGGGLTKTAALAIDKRRYQPDFGVIHTSTFAEDDLSSRVALRALALLDEEDVPGRCQRLGEALAAQIEAVVAAHPTVLEPVRGRGLMLGLAFKPQAESASNAIRMLSDHGYLGYVIAGYMLHEEGFRVAPTLSAPVIRLEPSAFLDPDAISRFCRALDRLATIIERGNAYRLCRYVVDLAVPGDLAPVRDYNGHQPATRREKPTCEKRVAFVGHFIKARDALIWDPSLAELPEGAIESFQLATHRIFGPTIYDQIHVKSAIGETVHLSMIGVHLTSKAIEQAMRDRDTDWIVELVEEAVVKAREAGCQVVGLGGYTSIVTDNGRRIGEGGVALTTGNSLTVGMGLEALLEGALALGVEVETASLGVIGAAGNIGKVHAEVMAERVPRLVLVGRETGPRLVRVASRIYEAAYERLRAGDRGGVAGAIAGTRTVAALAERLPEGPLGDHLYAALAEELGEAAPIRVSSELSALAECRLIVAASNSARPLIHPEHLAAGPVVICDLSVPEDTAPEVEAARPDVRVIRGGLVAIPNDPHYRIAGVPLSAGHAFACMSETLLLGLMGVREHFSYGPVEPAKVKQAMAWAAVNGFKLGADKTDRSY